MDARCQVTNHYHLPVETLDGDFSKRIRHLNGVYTQRFNRRYHRVGHVCQGRFKVVLVKMGRHRLELARYVARSPVRAGDGGRRRALALEQLSVHRESCAKPVGARPGLAARRIRLAEGCCGEEIQGIRGG